MKSLVGVRASPHTLPDDRDDRALIWMGGERHADKARQDMYAIDRWRKPNEPMVEPKRPRSDRALAKEAADRFFDPQNEGARKAIADRLREKFSGTYMRKQGKDGGINFEETYVYRAV